MGITKISSKETGQRKINYSKKWNKEKFQLIQNSDTISKTHRQKSHNQKPVTKSNPLTTSTRGEKNKEMPTTEVDKITLVEKQCA